MTILQAVALGFIQGATEFLPISSSGHLVLTGALIGVSADFNLAFGVFLHLATALAVIVFFWRRFGGLVKVFFANPVRWLTKKPIPDGDRRLGRLLVAVIIGTLPAVALGLLFKAQVDEVFQEPRLAAWMLFGTAAILFSLLLVKRGRECLAEERSPEAPAPVWWKALLIGCAQAVAILPGISRSGSTIVAGIHLGEDQRQAAEFSFLLSLPAILGANLLEAGDALAAGAWLPWPVYLAGGVMAFLTALLAIKLAFKTIAAGRFWLFGVYCVVAGAVSLLLV